ncbi:collagen alpha-5(IV) chain-like [Hylaeus volcanicus]|uniref:collagen alpha-5(IV) chain-like n=1 Tax=Hylaeus volcanicus TaxID=313075 RepID=UPI0023B8594C|nr:collagen alpha-5(IV) chain-like [Hylaeus volcanicus]
MHYPLHITVLCTGLWILRGDAHAVKTGVNPEVLTSFAKNVASVLSSTLLSDFHDSSSNQTSNWGFQKKAHETQSLNAGIPEVGNPPIADKVVARFKRFTEKRQVPNEGRNGLQNGYLSSNLPRYSNNYNYESFKPYQFAANREPPLRPEESNIEGTENINPDTRDNSIDADINAGPFHYSNNYHRRIPEFKYKPDVVDPLPNANQYGQLGFPHYNHLQQTPGPPPAQSLNVDGLEPNSGPNGNIPPARLANRPYNLNYQGPFPGPQRSPVYRQPGFIYPNVEGNGQPPSPRPEQIENNPSRLTEDQNQGQSAVAGYDFHPGFPYRPYPGGFYGSPPFYGGPYYPFNGTFNPGDVGPPGGNFTNGQFPNGFPGYGFNPYGPYYPNFNGKPPLQNPPENAGNAEQSNGGQGNGNATGNPPYGYPYPPNGPFYDLPGVVGVVGPINGVPYHRYHHSFDHFIPRIKVAPYLYPEPYGPFIPGPYYPFGGPFPKHNGNPQGMMPDNSAKPVEAEKVEGAEGPAMPANGDAEVISESKPDEVETLPSNGNEKFRFPWHLYGNDDKLAREVNIGFAKRDSDD